MRLIKGSDTTSAEDAWPSCCLARILPNAAPMMSASSTCSWSQRACASTDWAKRGIFGIFEAESRFVTGLGRSHPVENGSRGTQRSACHICPAATMAHGSGSVGLEISDVCTGTERRLKEVYNGR